jgi:hypothetical protein
VTFVQAFFVGGSLKSEVIMPMALSVCTSHQGRKGRQVLLGISFAMGSILRSLLRLGWRKPDIVAYKVAVCRDGGDGSDEGGDKSPQSKCPGGCSGELYLITCILCLLGVVGITLISVYSVCFVVVNSWKLLGSRTGACAGRDELLVWHDTSGGPAFVTIRGA